MSIQPISSCSALIYDWEYKAIIRKLAQYGLRPTGNKSSDKMMLRQIELREAQKEESVTSRFLTVSKGEQEKIQEKKAEKQSLGNTQLQDAQLGQQLLGEQLMLAIEMKKKKKV